MTSTEPKKTILIAGCGYVGTRLAELLLLDGHRVIGVRRNWRSPGPAGMLTVSANLARSDTMPANLNVDQIVYAVSPDQYSEVAYRSAYIETLAAVIAFAKSTLKNQQMAPQLVFVSSTGIYGTGSGEWVDENTEFIGNEHCSFSSEALRQAEAMVFASGLSHTSVRFGGIYGPGRQVY